LGGMVVRIADASRNHTSPQLAIENGIKSGRKMGCPIGPRRLEWGAPSARGAKKTKKISKKIKRKKKEEGIPHHRSILAKKVANMVPNLSP